MVSVTMAVVGGTVVRVTFEEGVLTGVSPAGMDKEPDVPASLDEGRKEGSKEGSKLADVEVGRVLEPEERETTPEDGVLVMGLLAMTEPDVKMGRMLMMSVGAPGGELVFRVWHSGG